MQKLRKWVLELFGISLEKTDLSDWWEIDLIAILFVGAWAIGIWAWMQP